MKLVYKFIIASAFFFPIPASGAGIQMDPLLVGTIITQTETLKNCYKKRSKTQEAIIVAQAGIATGLEYIHEVEDKMLEYLSHASSVLQNMIQIKKIGELVAIEIPNNLTKLAKDIPDNIKGTAITLFVNKTIQETTTDIVELSDIVNRLVTSHYSFKDKKDDDKNINLLSAAERYTILQSVYRKLDSINWRLRLTRYYIKTFGWQELWKGIDREGWCKAMYGKVLAKQLINRWNELF